jgi:hypothetical protein
VPASRHELTALMVRQVAENAVLHCRDAVRERRRASGRKPLQIGTPMSDEAPNVSGIARNTSLSSRFGPVAGVGWRGDPVLARIDFDQGKKRRVVAQARRRRPDFLR